MLNNIKQYITGCERCQANKPNQKLKRNYLYPNKVLQGPWETISINLIGLLLESTGYDGILVIVDLFSKMACYIPININISAQGVAKISWDWVFKDMGIPQKVISDWGPQFVSRFMEEFTRNLNNISNFTVVTDKMIGQSSYQLQNSPTTIDFTLVQDSPHSWLT